MLQTLSISLLPALMIVAAMTDVTSFRIPNWLTATIAILFVPMAFATGMPIADFGWHLAGGLILFVIGYLMFAVGIFGGGDAKLMAAAGLWFGTDLTVPFLLMTAIAGGALAVAVSSWSAFMVMWEIHGGDQRPVMDRQLKKIKPKLPYGFAFAVGAILAFPQTWWMNIS
jgi:prepilin peptidase CpaA